MTHAAFWRVNPSGTEAWRGHRHQQRRLALPSGLKVTDSLFDEISPGKA